MKKTEYPLVSIIIPVYNSEKYLAECIESAIAQTWSNKEIIIVDDGSTDNSYNIAKKYAILLNIKVIRQINKGASAARNTGLNETRGDYIQFLDADDLLSPDKIEAQINCLNGSITHLALSRTVHFNEKEDHHKESLINDWYFTDSDDPVDFLLKLYAGDEVMPGYGGMIQPNAWLSPRNLIDTAGPWNEKLSLDDDGEFFCRVVLASSGIKFSKEGMNYYRKFNDGKSLSAQKTRIGIESAILANDLKFSYLKAKANNPIVDRIFAKHYWWTGVLAYPQFKNLSKYCIKKGTELGYAGTKYTGGPSGHIVANFLGWKAARYFSLYQQVFKNIVAKSKTNVC